MLHTIIDLLFHASPWLVYLIVGIFLLSESTGIPVVNNTLLLLTGALSSMGRLNIWLLIFSALLGSILGACIAYLIGERGGQRVLLRAASIFRIKEQDVHLAAGWFQRSGAWMIFFSRLIPYIRPFSCFFAGISRLSYRRFFAAASLGSLIWCVTMVHIGSMLGKQWGIGLRLMSEYTLPTCVALLVLTVAGFLGIRMLRGRVRSHLLKAQAEAEEAANAESELLNV